MCEIVKYINIDNVNINYKLISYHNFMMLLCKHGFVLVCKLLHWLLSKLFRNGFCIFMLKLAFYRFRLLWDEFNWNIGFTFSFYCISFYEKVLENYLCTLRFRVAKLRHNKSKTFFLFRIHSCILLHDVSQMMLVHETDKMKNIGNVFQEIDGVIYLFVCSCDNLLDFNLNFTEM
jgi:hypothetical protein